MSLGDGVRRNIRTISAEESRRFTRALLALQGTAASLNDRRGADFLPWHRELCNRFEDLLRQIDPALSLHYWDWNEDPRDLFTPTFGLAEPVVSRTAAAGAAGRHPVAADAVILRAPSFHRLSALLERKHAYARRSYFGDAVVNGHVSLYDPFGMLLHANLDRLFAMWQAASGDAWRLDPTRVFGDDARDLANRLVEPWTNETLGIPAWTAGDTGSAKTYVHPSVVAPPCYDTLPVTIEVDEVTTPRQTIHFRDVHPGRTFARAASFRVSGRGNLTFSVVDGPTAPYSLLTPGRTIPAAHCATLSQEVRVWFGYKGERADTHAPEGSVTIRCDELDQSFVFRLRANTVAPGAEVRERDADDKAARQSGFLGGDEPGAVTWTWTWRSFVAGPREVSA